MARQFSPTLFFRQVPNEMPDRHFQGKQLQRRPQCPTGLCRNSEVVPKVGGTGECPSASLPRRIILQRPRRTKGLCGSVQMVKPCSRWFIGKRNTGKNIRNRTIHDLVIFATTMSKRRLQKRRNGRRSGSRRNDFRPFSLAGGTKY